MVYKCFYIKVYRNMIHIEFGNKIIDIDLYQLIQRWEFIISLIIISTVLFVLYKVYMRRLDNKDSYCSMDSFGYSSNPISSSVSIIFYGFTNMYICGRKVIGRQAKLKDYLYFLGLISLMIFVIIYLIAICLDINSYNNFFNTPVWLFNN